MELESVALELQAGRFMQVGRRGREGLCGKEEEEEEEEEEDGMLNATRCCTHN